MDPVDAITHITAAVLRRIADTINTPDPQPDPVLPPIVVHVDCPHTHSPQPRARFGRRQP